MITCKDCGYSYQPHIAACPECGNPTSHNRVNRQSDMGAKTPSSNSCMSCGAPSTGDANCQWCGNAFPVKVSMGGSGGISTNNQIILECEFQRVVDSRNAFPYVICYVNVNGHTLMQLNDDGSPHGIELWLLDLSGKVGENFHAYSENHSFTRNGQGQCFKAFGVDFRSAAETADNILRQVYEVTNEKVMCSFEYGQNQQTGSNNSGDVVAAGVVGGVIGALIDW